MAYRRPLSIVLVLIALMVCRPALAEPPQAGTPTAPTASAPPAQTSAQPIAKNDGNATRIGGKVMVAVGGAAVIAGVFVAAHYQQGIGGCDSAGNCTQESGRAPLGLAVATVGAVLAMVGACIWLSVPSTNATVGLGPSGLAVAGRF